MFYFDPPDRFVAGTVGEPGQRTFFLQARKASQVVSVTLEKVQVQVLAERLDQLLDELEDRGVTQTKPADVLQDTGPLDQPLHKACPATTLARDWGADTGRALVEKQTDPVEIEIELEADPDDVGEADDEAAAVEAAGGQAVAELDASLAASIRAAFEAAGIEEDEDEDDDDDLEGPDVLRVRVSAAAARAFVERAARVVASGRPPCPLCGQPLDPQGHICPRRNGHFLN